VTLFYLEYGQPRLELDGSRFKTGVRVILIGIRSSSIGHESTSLEVNAVTKSERKY
jgi:hypothetical protein